MKDISLQSASFPGTEDLSGAANALLRLQDTYNLPTEQIAQGELQGVQESPKLTGNSACRCFIKSWFMAWPIILHMYEYLSLPVYMHVWARLA